ncbi:MAG: pilus assembly protein TadG-related protein [Acidimicrobiia bacterium]
MNPPSERGSVSAFAAGITVALIVAAGLVIDGGAMLAARRQAVSDADAAARAGAQMIDEDRLHADGRTVLDTEGSAAAARAFLASVGRRGEVSATPDQITVTVHVDQPMYVLGLAGIGTKTVTGRATARPVRGVNEGET